MGNKSASKTNAMLEDQTTRANNLETLMGSRGYAAYNQQEGLRNELLGNYRSMYSGAGSGEGAGAGGGGYSYSPVDFTSSSLPFYMEAMNTGLYSPERQGQAESYATGPITGLYEGLKRQLETALAGRGVSPSYGGSLSRLGRDRAQEMNRAALAAKLGINREIDVNRFTGAGGVTGVESEKRAFEAQERGRAASAAASRSSAADADRAFQMSVLGRMQGLMPEDLPYIDRQLASQSAAQSSIAGRQKEGFDWGKAAKIAAAAAATYFSGGAAAPALAGAIGSKGMDRSSGMRAFEYGIPNQGELDYMYGGG